MLADDSILATHFLFCFDFADFTVMFLVLKLLCGSTGAPPGTRMDSDVLNVM